MNIYPEPAISDTLNTFKTRKKVHTNFPRIFILFAPIKNFKFYGLDHEAETIFIPYLFFKPEPTSSDDLITP